MMHWNDETCAGGIGHGDGLFGSGMRPNPRVVGADAHDGEIVGRAGMQFRKRIGSGGVTPINKPPVVSRNDVAGVAAMYVVVHAGAQMLWRMRTDCERAIARP